MKKTIIQSSALAIICLLAVSSKSFAQEKEKPTVERPDQCKDHGGTVHFDKDSKGGTFRQCGDGRTITTSGRRRK